VREAVGAGLAHEAVVHQAGGLRSDVLRGGQQREAGPGADLGVELAPRGEDRDEVGDDREHRVLEAVPDCRAHRGVGVERPDARGR
jgi:hypothetical protein